MSSPTLTLKTVIFFFRIVKQFDYLFTDIDLALSFNFIYLIGVSLLYSIVLVSAD